MADALLLPRGFRVGGSHCGIKLDPQRRDLALFVSEQPATAAGVFTQNQVVGAPVILSRTRVPSDRARAVIINSGIANACTGELGLQHALEMTSHVATSLGCDENAVLICSTGVIGRQLPMPALAAGIGTLALQLGVSNEHLEAAARGMMTTDTVPKITTRTVNIDGTEIRITGVAKGAAMIGPNMATMLAVLMTDAALSTDTATPLLKQAVDRSFNCISVEGHTSTSDTVLLLANGTSGCDASHDVPFADAVTDVCEELAQMIVRDAEGAAHFVTIDVVGAASESDARRVAKAIANDALVKTAYTGNDPNWGRIISATGNSGVSVRETDLALRINGTLIYESGRPSEFDEEIVSRAMATGEVTVELNLGNGTASARFWTSDLTQEYVRLNSEYTT